MDFLEIKKLTEQLCPAHILPIIYADEYRDEEGVIRCKVCGGARSVKIGAELWAQEKMFDIINRRYNAR